MARRKSRIAPAKVPEADPWPPAPTDVIRAGVVPVDTLADTLNRWVAEGFVEWDFHVIDTEAPSFGEHVPRVMVWAWRE